MASTSFSEEEVDQKIALCLQEIDANYTKSHAVASRLLGRVKAYRGDMTQIHGHLHVWRQFFSHFDKDAAAVAVAAAATLGSSSPFPSSSSSSPAPAAGGAGGAGGLARPALSSSVASVATPLAASSASYRCEASPTIPNMAMSCVKPAGGAGVVMSDTSSIATTMDGACSPPTTTPFMKVMEAPAQKGMGRWRGEGCVRCDHAVGRGAEGVALS